MPSKFLSFLQTSVIGIIAFSPPNWFSNTSALGLIKTSLSLLSPKFIILKSHAIRGCELKIKVNKTLR